MSNKEKVKGLFKGLRYISEIFDNEKEQEIEIGFPTDVIHVAHIGCDGPSVNNPSWMNDFKSNPGSASVPLNHNNGDIKKRPDDSVKCVSEDLRSRSTASNSPAKDQPDLPKATRRQSTGGMTDSPAREKSDKPKSSRQRPSKPKDSSDGSRLSRKQVPTVSPQGSESPASSTPDAPKKTRRKKSKDTPTNGGAASSSRSKVKAHTCYSDSNSDLVSVLHS